MRVRGVGGNCGCENDAGKAFGGGVVKGREVREELRRCGKKKEDMEGRKMWKEERRRRKDKGERMKEGR